MKNFYSKFFAVLCTLMMVAGNALADKAVQLPLNNGGGMVDGVNYSYTSPSWAGTTEIYGSGNIEATWGTIKISSESTIKKVELNCATNSWTSASISQIAYTVIETEDLNGSMSVNTTTAIWEGSSNLVVFSSTDDIDVNGITVYIEEGSGSGTKDCSVEYDHLGFNIGEVNGISSSLTLYYNVGMLNDYTTWQGGGQTPEGVVIESEKGNIEVTAFQYWASADWQGYWQLALTLAHGVEKTLDTAGEYTLVIPEGLIRFTNGKYNKAVRLTMTILPPTTFHVDTYTGITPAGWPALKSLDSFTVSAPEDVEFKYADGEKFTATINIATGGYEDEGTDVEVTCTGYANKVEFAFPEAYTEKGSVRVTVPEGVIESSHGLFNEEFSASWSIDPTEYFSFVSVTPGSYETVAPYNSIVLTLPEGIVPATIGSTVFFQQLNEDVDVTPEVNGNEVTLNLAKQINDYDSFFFPEGFIVAEDGSISTSHWTWNVTVDPTLTGINNVATSKNATIYDLSGRRVVNAQNGLYIVNGKKVIR